MTGRSLVGLAVAIVMSGSWYGGDPLAFAQAGPDRCAAVPKFQWPDVRITDTWAVPESAAGRIRAAHCRVEGTIGTEIRFAVLLPHQWNGKFFMGGGGGFAGAVENSAEETLNVGFATAGTDTGHEGDGMSARWALNSPERQANFGHLAVHRTAEVSKAVIQAYYGRASTKNYFFGCSRGGGQAVMEAIRYPEDFDGLVAGAPALDWTGIAARFVVDAQAVFPDPRRPITSVLPIGTLQFVERRILAACDAIDGVTDDVMTDPRRCTFDVDSLPSCPGAAAGTECVTEPQRAALRTIYGEIRNEDGVIYPGQPFGSEGNPAGWPAWITGSPLNAPGVPPVRSVLVTEFFRYFVFGDPAWTYGRYDLRTWKADMKNLGAILNATDPDLDRFKARDGRLVLYHGWSDPAVSALRTLDYYDAVASRDPNVRAHVRMFLMPGVLHCGLGPGPDTIDWTQAIVDWVENQRAPDRVVARRIVNDAVMASRPLCAYPLRPENRGSGSTNDEANFVCK